MTRTRHSQHWTLLLRRTLVAATLTVSLGLASAIPATNDPKSNQPAARNSPAKNDLALRVTSLSVTSPPVVGRDRQPDLSPELMHDLPDANPNRDEPTARPGSGLSVPFLRGVYVGAARTFIQSNGKSRVVWLEVTGYCPCVKCCGPNANGITASGKPVSYHDGAFAAADPELFAFGTTVRVPGYRQGISTEIIDRGSAIKGARLDVFFATHEEAEAWGRQWVPVVVDE